MRPSIEKWFEGGAVLFRAGDPCQAVALIHEGEVELLEEIDNRAYRIGKRGAGTYVGDSAVLSTGVWPYAARALQSTRLEMISGGIFQEQNAARQTASNDDGSNAGRMRDAFVRPPLFPVVRLQPASAAAARAMPADGIEIMAFPFIVGRLSRGVVDEGAVVRSSFLIEDRQPYHLSRRQFAVVRLGETVAVSDSGSRLGTLVDGQPLGLEPMPISAGRTVEIHAGGHASPYRFRLQAD